MMRTGWIRLWIVLASAAIVTPGLTAVATSASAQPVPAAARSVAHRLATAVTGLDYQHACAVPGPGQAACAALIRTNVPHHRQPTEDPAAAPTGDGYGPSSLQSAYKLPSSTAGAGQTVAVVDAYNDPNAAADLAAYRSAWGLPACGTGCFSVVNENGAASPLPTSAAGTGWDVEESLDVDMVSAVCPLCHIILVEANSPALTDLGTGVNSAVSLGAKFVSNSYGASEFSGETSDDTYYNHPSVVVTASAGDSGYGSQYPAASQYVTAVGGTTLTTASNARGWSETVWSGTGSGCSAYEPKPSWQHDTGCTHRTNNDIAADANPSTGVAVYDTLTEGGWLEIGGTSVASPIIAAAYALMGQTAAGTYPSSYIYQNTASLFDVTSGSNGSCSPAYLCTGVAGYDGPTGWGAPDGIGAFTPPNPAVPFEMAFQASTGSLSTTGADSHGSWNLAMMKGTSPGVADLTTGRYEVAFQGSDGDLWVGNSTAYVGTNLSLAMMPGTSPAIAALPGGGYEIAFQGSNGDLWTTGFSGTADLGLGMMKGTSPAITGLSSGGYEMAFQANTGQLWSTGTAGTANWTLGLMAGTSPAITGLSNGTYEMAFQANTGQLWSRNSTGANGINWTLGLMAGTSPAIASQGSGYEMAFQANTGQLWTRNSTGANGTDWGLGLMAGTSPAITPQAGGSYGLAFQASPGNLWTLNTGNAGSAWNWHLGLLSGTSPSASS